MLYRIKNKELKKLLAKIVKDTLQQDERLIENDEFNMIKFFDLLEK